MVFFKDLQEYVHQSTLLLSARPATTKITTRYALCPESKLQRRLHRRKMILKSSATDPTTTNEVIQGSLVLKTYDPVSGTVLKYRTDRAAEVGRLMAGLHRCGKVMAVHQETLETELGDAKVNDEKLAEERKAVSSSSGARTAENKGAEQQQQQQQQGQAMGGGKRKKKRQ